MSSLRRGSLSGYTSSSKPANTSHALPDRPHGKSLASRLCQQIPVSPERRAPREEEEEEAEEEEKDSHGLAPRVSR